ncbi:ubiquitin protein ligase [Malassezia pachydermatis]
MQRPISTPWQADVDAPESLASSMIHTTDPQSDGPTLEAQPTDVTDVSQQPPTRLDPETAPEDIHSEQHSPNLWSILNSWATRIRDVLTPSMEPTEFDASSASPSDTSPTPTSAEEQSHTTDPPLEANTQDDSESATPAPASIGATNTVPMPTPPRPSESADNTNRATSTADEQGGTNRGSHFLLFIPPEASPFPFGFLYDASTSMAWPVLDRVQQPAPDDPTDTQRNVHIAGLPFHLTFAMRPSQRDEEPDQEKAKKYVKSLERVDSELRGRMGYFGLSDISIYGIAAEDTEAKTVTGCGICLEPYATEDRPAWFAGEESSENEAVVAVPCSGLHTLHAGCLLEWLSSKPPSKWTCPFCREPLPIEEDGSPKGLTTQSIRELVREKERKADLRCDAPACLPAYYDDEKQYSQKIELLPCRHHIHLDCLCTGIRVEMGTQADMYSDYEDDEDDDDNENDDENDTCITPDMISSIHTDQGFARNQQDTIGKWVTCPTCRKDAWVRLPTRPRPRRRRATYAQMSQSLYV